MSDAETRDHVDEALVTLRTRVDAHFDAVHQRSPAQVQCKPGCDRCCHVDLSVFEVEAARVRTALAALRPAERARVRAQADSVAHCALLLEGRCVVYDQRPVICRSHGAPVLVEHPDGARIENCELNFRDADPPPASVLRLEAINQPLSVMARMWDGHGQRVALRRLALET